MGNAMYRKQATNKEYQSWTGYPDSIVKTVDYPYQALAWSGGVVRLYCSSVPLKVNAGHTAFQVASTVIDGHYLIWQYNPSGVTWVYYTDGWYMGIAAIEQANHDVCEQDGTTVYFAKTTTAEQDEGNTTSLIRIRNLHHKDGASLIRNKAAFWKENVASGYQQWTGYPDTPELTANWPYQYITYKGYYALYIGTSSFYRDASNIKSLNLFKAYQIIDGIWVFDHDVPGGNSTAKGTLQESNSDIYTSYILTSVYFPKTTTPSQDAGITQTLHRINI